MKKLWKRNADAAATLPPTRLFPEGVPEILFQNVCNGNINGNGQFTYPDVHTSPPKCHFVHHSNPFLNLGPFFIEIKFYSPFRSIIHEFFFSEEISWMLDHAKPKLTKVREDNSRTRDRSKDKDYIDGLSKKVNAIKLATTINIKDIIYTETDKYYKTNLKENYVEYNTFPLKDPYNFNITHHTMLKVSRRIELATNLNVTTRYGASLYQATTYGLSGMTVAHQDPLGYESGVELYESAKHYIRTGDYIATFMGWLDDTMVGGRTAFTSRLFEGTVEPRKGSAAFWINLASCHKKDKRSTHVGCPVLKGSKWILNRWVYSFDQWKKWPCKQFPMLSMSAFNGMTA